MGERAQTVLDQWQILPRLMMLTVTILTYKSVFWFMALENPSNAQAGLVSVCMGALTGCFGIWVNGESKTNYVSKPKDDR